MIAPDMVSAVLVTRGDVDMTRIVESIRSQGIDDVVVWDNSERDDLGIYGRYAAAMEATNPVIVTQDDDLLVSCYDKLLADYQPGVLTVNYPEPWDIPWVGRGAIFDRSLPGEAFARYLHSYPLDRLFTHRICDAVFGLLSETVVVDYGSKDLPHGLKAGRVSTSPRWYERDRPEAKNRCEAILARAAA